MTSEWTKVSLSLQMAKNGELEMQKVIVVGAALYAGKRGDDVHVYELRDGEWLYLSTTVSAV